MADATRIACALPDGFNHVCIERTDGAVCVHSEIDVCMVTYSFPTTPAIVGFKTAGSQFKCDTLIIMKRVFFLLLLNLLAVKAQADLSTHAFFKHFIGTWKAAGELKGQDGNKITITEEWTGKVDGENSFLIEGTRTMNSDTQPFKWTITHNAGTDLFEAVLTGAEASQTIRFEGNVSEVNMSLELKAVTGAGDSAITVTDTLQGEAKDVIESKVTFTGEAGQTTLEGTIKHEKQKAP